MNSQQVHSGNALPLYCNSRRHSLIASHPYFHANHQNYSFATSPRAGPSPSCQTDGALVWFDDSHQVMVLRETGQAVFLLEHGSHLASCRLPDLQQTREECPRNYAAMPRPPINQRQPSTLVLLSHPESISGSQISPDRVGLEASTGRPRSTFREELAEVTSSRTDSLGQRRFV